MIRINTHLEVNGSVRATAKWFKTLEEAVSYVEWCFYVVGIFNKRSKEDQNYSFRVFAVIYKIYLGKPITFVGSEGKVHFILMDREKALKNLRDVEELLIEFESVFTTFPEDLPYTHETELPF